MNFLMRKRKLEHKGIQDKQEKPSKVDDTVGNSLRANTVITRGNDVLAYLSLTNYNETLNNLFQNATGRCQEKLLQHKRL